MGEFNTIFKQLRLEKGFSQQELADKLGVSKSSVNMYERGERQPNFETLELIADFFNVDTDYLLGRTDKTTKVISPYYQNDETREIAQEIFENPDMRSLFDMSRKMEPDRLKAHLALMKQLLGNEEND